MRQSHLASIGIVAVFLLLAAGPAAFAGKPGNAPRKSPQKVKRPAQPGPGMPTGVPRPIVTTSSGYERDASQTITAHRNEQGETVYAIEASHFDLSAPLRDMAAGAAVAPESEEESPTNPLLPRWRIPRSELPDPVVQSDLPSAGTSGLRPITMDLPSTGFNFTGLVQNGGVPSDSNGSVGNNQFVETVNVRYQVWSLDRGTSTATPIIGPTSINVLWTGFGGPCQLQNSGDPIVVYDKLADRWLISQFTSALSGESYYQCVAVSTSADATGTYARWAFAVPISAFGDYPHFGVWPDAYYMMAHAFTSAGAGGTYVGGVFAAMDRAKMLAGNPAATWQVIIDSNEGGHMPADLDGVAPPPTGAPGIFLSIHGASMYFYRMKVDFTTPANTGKSVQGTAPIAPATGACMLAAIPGTCIPQPGTTRLLDSLGDRLMFRAAYRNFIDHESIVVSHSVDPSVAGLVAGVRWYDFRISGTPDATCATYPCTRQQGTIADVANGRNRWMPSIAMDGAENILVAYSTSGKTNGVENHSIRYTGRTKGDPLGVMTVPEATIVTGTSNETTNSRWGDYTSVSVDPFDDCTLWHTNEYYTVANNWKTQIASAVWPAGTGAGQCPPTSCTARPAGVPTIGSSSAAGPNQISISWFGVVPQPGAYAIERAVGACGSEGLYQPLASVGGGAGSFIDTTVQGGLTYSYRVIAASDAAGRCQGLAASGCVSVTATGLCNLKPQFAGASVATSNDASTCGVRVSWPAAASSCPLTPNLRYNIFRGTTPDFVPSAGNRIATCVPGPTSYLDVNNLSSGTTYYYVVRSEDDSTGHGGECNGGNEEANSIVVSGTAYGPGTQATPGTWTDSGGDGTAFLRRNVAGGGNTGDQAWRFVKTADDAGANHTAGGAYAYRNTGPAAADLYLPGVCAEIQTPPLTVGATTTTLQYWERHQLEYHWDGIVVEYARNGGPWTTVPAPSNATAAGCAATDAITNWETLSCTGAPPANACGYATTTNAINGPLASGTTCNDWATGPAVTSYAHRCHPIAGLAPGDAMQYRWRFTSDPGAQYGGFYLDDLAITNTQLPNTCLPDLCATQADGSPCSDGNACTSGEVCGAGACGGGAPIVPAVVNDSLAFDTTSTVLSWTDPPGNYSVYRGTRTNGVPFAYNHTCFASRIATSSTTDAEVPPVGTVFLYLVSRVEACGESILGKDSGGVPVPNTSPCP